VRLEVDDLVVVPMPSGPDKIVLLFNCPKCGKSLEIDHFGVRRFKGEGPDGTDLLRRQSWCRSCR